jgi:acyl-coenzyme A synthetase/AMP-(fatty) acid ligase
VVYGGFSVEALAERIEDANSRVLITADGGYRRGSVTDLKGIANEAMKRSPTIEVCIAVKRTGHEVYMENDRDFWYHNLISMPIGNAKCETEVMDAEDMLFILYTSGTTGRPKGVLHTHGGYAVYTSTTHRMVFDVKEDDRWWCAADPGWITGHSYIVYGPLINGSTIMMYEGAPNHPYSNRWWQTESGEFMITPLLLTPLTPGSATKPFFGNEVAVVDNKGKEVKTGEEGNLVIKSPWPGMARTIYGDPERFKEIYWQEYEKQGWYKAGDSARIDKDGYVWIIGRIDDVIKVSGYRLGSAEIESALVSHPSVSEAAAIALPHELKGNAIHSKN